MQESLSKVRWWIKRGCSSCIYLLRVGVERLLTIPLIQMGIKCVTFWRIANKNLPKSQHYTKDELEFMSAKLEMEQTPANPIGRSLIYFLILFFCLALLWSIFGRTDVVVVSSGKLLPDGYVKKLQSATGGTIAKIEVKDGDMVARGQEIIRLQEDASLGAAKRKEALDISMSSLEVAYYKSILQIFSEEKTQSQVLSDIPAPINIRSLYKDRLRHAILSYRKGLDSFRVKKSNIEVQILSNKMEIDKLKRDFAIAKLKYSVNKKLVNKHLISMLAFEKSRQEAIGFEAAIKAKGLVLKQLGLSLKGLAANLAERKHMYKKDIIKKLLAAQHKLQQEKFSYYSTVKTLHQLSITSPIKGTIQQLQLHTIGGVVKTGEIIATIVPYGTPLGAQVLIRNRDIGFVKVGQTVKVKVNSFPFTEYGYLTGKIRFISKDAINHRTLGLVYQGNVTLNSQTLNVDHVPIRLRPGMTVSAEIKTGKRRLIEYILSPLLKTKSEAFRQR